MPDKGIRCRDQANREISDRILKSLPKSPAAARSRGADPPPSVGLWIILLEQMVPASGGWGGVRSRDRLFWGRAAAG